MSQDRRENAGFPRWGEAVHVDAHAPPANTATDNYRVCAVKLRALAAESPDAVTRAYLLATAAQFDRLADYAAASGSKPHAA